MVGEVVVVVVGEVRVERDGRGGGGWGREGCWAEFDASDALCSQFVGKIKLWEVN